MTQRGNSKQEQELQVFLKMEQRERKPSSLRKIILPGENLQGSENCAKSTMVCGSVRTSRR